MKAPKPRNLDFAALELALEKGEIVPLQADSWNRIREHYEVRDEIPTSMAGSILLIRRGKSAGRKRAGWLLVEEPEPGIRVARPFATERKARALIQDRLAAYERMWDG